MQDTAHKLRLSGATIGFIPTMGALHEGHAALIRRARRENDRVIVSIFVNPAQFGPREDLKRYPRPFGADCRTARAAGADMVFAPRPDDMYPSGDSTWVTVERLSAGLCGDSRPGHFRGVATVVAKFFSIIGPCRAYFGLKDYQQYAIIRRMTRDLHFPVRVIACPTVRESSGLARSSRNEFLSSAERAAAAGIYRALRAGARAVRSGRSAGAAERSVRAMLSAIPGARIDYASVVDARDLCAPRRPGGMLCIAAAVWMGRTRLIDNIIAQRRPS